jgi:SAM-dependent methyltransferase
MPADRRVAEGHRALYAGAAGAWDRRRSRALFERGWLERFRALLPAGAPVLDLGCGTGEPVAAWLIAAGHPVVGIDFAEPMLAIARARLPGAEWRTGDMRELALGRRFGGIVAWDSFFHLTADEQRAVFPRFAAHLEPGGALLFTAGPAAGEATGAVEGRPVYHASLSPAEYAGLMEANGLAPRAFVAEDPDCAGHCVGLGRGGG